MTAMLYAANTRGVSLAASETAPLYVSQKAAPLQDRSTRPASSK